MITQWLVNYLHLQLHLQENKDSAALCTPALPNANARHAGAERVLLAPEDLPGTNSTCFGDRAAGCCGAARCERIPEDEGHIFAATKEVTTIAGETYTTFNFSLAGAATVRGGDTRQVALLLTLDAMAELSVVRDALSEPDGSPPPLLDTHIGCNPLDGFVAFRQRLDCPSCDGEEILGHVLTFSVKVPPLTGQASFL